MTRLQHFLFVVVFVNLSAVAAMAQLSPGDLSQAHSKLEGLDNCRACHGSDRKQISPNCLACHSLIQNEINANSGLHGRNHYQVCEECHVEHHGRDFQLIYWKDGESKFDHTLTGYELNGAHKPLQCRQCHTAKNVRPDLKDGDTKKNPNRTFLGLSTACSSCHFDEHRGQVSKQCETCHSNIAWKPATSFDHQRAKFPLTGLHQKVECAKCHSVLIDRTTPADTTYLKFAGLNFTECSSCHKDPHANRLGPNCAPCHNTSGWRSLDNNKFDHSKTRFPLLGRHVALQCAKCHKQEEPRRQMAFSNCSDCHSDFHDGAFIASAGGPKCERCHNVDGFLPGIFTVEQHDSTSYPLKGSHLAVPCEGCHATSTAGKTPRQYTFAHKDTTCITCHKDPHSGKADKTIKASGCEGCHNVESWKNATFAHEATKFPLTGKHSSIKCLECHGNKNDKTNVSLLTFELLPRNCNECHNDIHGGQFAADGRTACDRCHQTDNWKASKFNHDRDSRYRLEGAHAKVPCGECHKNVIQESTILVRYKPLSTACKDCHDSQTGKL